MFKNYLKIALRNLLRHKAYSFINIFGLAVGMACCLLILLFVQDELSYDRFHEKAGQIYRVVTDNSLVTPGPLAKVLQEELPEAGQVTRLYAAKLWGSSSLVSYEDKHFYTEDFFLVDPNFFEIFTFPFIKGEARRALAGPASIVITREMASKYFGDQEPLGKVLVFENQYEFKVTGVAENVPRNSHLRFDFLAPLEFYRVMHAAPKGLEEWFNHAFATYILLRENKTPVELEAKLPAILRKRAGDDFDFQFSLQPLADIHLHSHLRREIGANSDVRYIYIFSAAAVLILAIACINFMNLSTARSANRAREVGMRKVVGASRPQLIRQFLSESMLMSLLALVLAVLLVELLLPAFNALTGKDIVIEAKNHFLYGLALFGFMLIVGIFSGSYPAFFLSRFQPATVLKGALTAGTRSHAPLRSSLVVFQFAIAIGLMVGAIIIQEQMAYVQAKNLGFAKEQVVVIPTRQSEEVIAKVQTLKTAMAKHADMINVSASSQTPGRGLFRRAIKLEGAAEGDQFTPVYALWVDHEFLATYQIPLVAGRHFSKELISDATDALILNATAAKLLGFQDPESALGKRARTDRKIGEIIGVAEDFHFMSLHSKIDPIVMYIEPERFYYISARIRTENTGSTLAFFEKTWRTLLPNRPFEYFFLDDDFGRQYQAEERLGKIFIYFSGIAIVIACLGLLGLSAFIAEQKTKEIGIRKVLGATVANLIFLLSREFAVLALLANLIAWPLAYYGMSRWLQDFAYRTDIGWWVFALAGGIALLIALLTVSTQAIKAALANPVEALRYE